MTSFGRAGKKTNQQINSFNTYKPRLNPAVLMFTMIGLIIYSCSQSSDPETEIRDSDGDGITDNLEIERGTDIMDPCDPFQSAGYQGYDADNRIWSMADCDQDGITNAAELLAETDPYQSDFTAVDSDGDGLSDEEEISNGTDELNPCDPAQPSGYDGYDLNNSIWQAADCDLDGILNADELMLDSDPYEDERVFAVPELLPTLSELRIFAGQLSDLTLQSTSYEYELSTPLFTDYAIKMRAIALPKDGQMTYNGEGLLNFPDNTVISKTFYYYQDERDPSLGKTIIETRILIKQNGNWVAGNYIWNASQTEAFLDPNSQTVSISWIDASGTTNNVDYRVPSNNNCVQCHSKDDSMQPIGPKSRALNTMHNGSNQLDAFAEQGILLDAPASGEIAVLPDWSDVSFTLEERARAYLDVNCAHCHQPGGFYPNGSFELRYETPFAESNIFENRVSIRDRMNSMITNYRMPLIGTSIPHSEGIELINEYIDSL